MACSGGHGGRGHSAEKMHGKRARCPQRILPARAYADRDSRRPWHTPDQGKPDPGTGDFVAENVWKPLIFRCARLVARVLPGSGGRGWIPSPRTEATVEGTTRRSGQPSSILGVAVSGSLNQRNHGAALSENGGDIADRRQKASGGFYPFLVPNGIDSRESILANSARRSARHRRRYGSKDSTPS